MIGANLINILSKTLNSNTIESSSLELNRMRNINGFPIELLVITDDTNQNIAIRQSAIIYLKNIVQDHCLQGGLICQGDLATLKENLLEGI